MPVLPRFNIKIFCLREQSTRQVRDHTSLELKKKDNNESYKIVSFGQGFEKRFVASLMEFAFFFNGFFDHFIGVFDYSRV